MPRFISQHVLAQIEKTVLATMTDTCLIENQLMGTDQYGGESESYTVVALAQPCRLILVSKKVRSSAGQVGAEQTIRDSYRLIVPAGSVTLTVGMRVTVNGNRYDVYALQESLTDGRFNEAFVSRQVGESLA